MTKCRNIGIESATINVTTIAKGDGPIIEDNQLCGSVQDISQGIDAFRCPVTINEVENIQWICEAAGGSGKASRG